MTDKTTACDSSERLVEWLVGGQVTDIRAGQGLISNRDDGVVNLALDPTVFQGCAGCGKISAGFNDGPLELPRFVIGKRYRKSPNLIYRQVTMPSSRSLL